MRNFINAMAEHSGYIKSRGYFPSVFLAQSILESGWGRSVLAQKFNFWGHKWKDGDDYEWTTKVSNEEIGGDMIPVESRFRAYKNMDEAIEAYCNKWEERWKNGMMKYNPDLSSPYNFVASIAGTYCNDSNYVSKIMAIINEWGLTEWD